MNFRGKPAEPVRDKRKKYKSVVEYMATELISFKPDDKIENAMEQLLQNRISGAPVLDENRHIVGVLSQKDCLRTILENAYYNMPPTEGLVHDYMTRDVATISAEDDVLSAAERFLNSYYRRFPVLNQEGRVIGQVSRRDILQAAMEIKKNSWLEKAKQQEEKAFGNQ